MNLNGHWISIGLSVVFLSQVAVFVKARLPWPFAVRLLLRGGWICIPVWLFFRYAQQEYLFVVGMACAGWLLLQVLRVVRSSLLARRAVRLCITAHNFGIAERTTARIAQSTDRVLFDKATTPAQFALPFLIIGILLARGQPLDVIISHYWWVALFFLHGCGSWFKQAMPGTVLLLGASTSERLRLQETLAAGLFPFRVVSLIETSSSADRFVASGDCFRVTSGHWKAAITAFMNSVIVIIMDDRDKTQHVEFEQAAIVSTNNIHKTIRIDPTRDATQDAETGEVVVASEAAALRVARNKLLYGLNFCGQKDQMMRFMQSIWKTKE